MSTYIILKLYQMSKLVDFQAQAQECILEKSMNDNRKSSITAKIAAQIVEYYKQTARYLDSKEGASIIGSRQTKVRVFVILSFDYMNLCIWVRDTFWWSMRE